MNFRAPFLLMLAPAALTAAAPASAAELPAGSTAILSGAPSLLETLPSPVDRARLTAEAVSASGGVVAFSSESDGLVDGDDDRVENVYVKSRATGAVILVSRRTGAAGAPADADCSGAAVSSDGKRVAFTCDGPLDPADTNGEQDVYLRDLTTSETILVSRSGPAGPVGDSGSFDPTINDDGRYVAFSSSAKNLDPAAQNGPTMVFRRDTVEGATVLVSRPSVGPAPMQGEEPTINDEGNRIAFTSATDEGGDANGARDVYLRSVPSTTTVLVSRADGDGAAGNRASSAPSIDGSGFVVAFESQASSFDTGSDPDASPDVYRRNLLAKTTTLVSENANGDKGQVSQAPSIDKTGDRVAFRSAGTQLHPDDADAGADAYVKNVASNELQLVSRADGAAGAASDAVELGAVAMSPNGGHIAFFQQDGRILPDVDPLRPTVALRDLSGASPTTASIARPAGTAPFVNQGGAATSAALSDDGRFAAFVSDARGLGLPVGAARAVFVRDRVTGEVVLASRADGANGAPIVPDREMPAISGDGRRVAWSVFAGPDRGVWVRDLVAGRTFLASRADGDAGAPGDGISTDPSLDADGDRVAFTSRAANLGDGDTDVQDDVHVRDLAAGRTLLVSASAGGQKGDRPSLDPALDASGTRVAFRSSATNLGDGDTDEVIDVHRKDLGTGAVELVSAVPGGPKGDGAALDVSIDGSGDRVAFSTTAANLGGAASTVTKVLVRDLAAGTLALASRADGAGGAPNDADAAGATISPDGTAVAFLSSAGNLVTGASGAVAQIYVRDLAAGRTALASRRHGSGEPVAQPPVPGDLSRGGACASFGSGDAVVGARVDQPQAYLRVLGADCVPSTGGGAGGGGGGAGGGGGGAGDGGGGSDASGDGPGGDGAADRTAPRLTSVRLRPAVLRIPRGRATAPKASVLAFRSSEAGALQLRVARRKPVRRFAAAQRATARAGANRLPITGRIGRRRLPAGTYRLTLTVRDAAGNTSQPITRRMKVVRGRAR